MFITSILFASGSQAWIFRLGGPGLIVVGLIDNSVIPIPGGMDVFTILLTAHHRAWWVYYGAMATLGAVIAATLRIAWQEKEAKLAWRERSAGGGRSESIRSSRKGDLPRYFLGLSCPLHSRWCRF